MVDFFTVLVLMVIFLPVFFIIGWMESAKWHKDNKRKAVNEEGLECIASVVISKERTYSYVFDVSVVDIYLNFESNEFRINIDGDEQLTLTGDIHSSLRDLDEHIIVEAIINKYIPWADTH